MEWKVDRREINELKPYPGNPRKMDSRTYEKLKNSIKEFGLVSVLTINQKNEVIGGNQRLRVLRELKWTEVPVIVISLPKNKERALNIALNKIQGDWDMPLLKDMLQEIDTGEINMELTGYDDRELEQLMTQFFMDSQEEQIETKNKCPHCGFEW